MAISLRQSPGRHPTQTPAHWIGVERGWQNLSRTPWSRFVYLPPEQLATHTLVIGATGSGKTNLIHHLIAQDIRLGRSFVVLDLRGDLVASALELCAGRVDHRLVRLFDLREKVRPTGFNPLFGHGEPYFRALNVLKAVEAESDSWGVQLAETLRFGLLLLAEVVQPVTKLEALFFDRMFLHGCLATCRDEQVLGFWRRFDELSQDKRISMAGPVLNKISLLLSTKSLRRTLGNPNPVDLRRHLDMRGSVTLTSLAGDELHGAGRMMGSLLLSSITRELFSRVDVGERFRNPVRIYVDEFEHFQATDIENILAEGRRFGVSLVLAHQTLAQLSPRMRSMVLNNVGCKVVFRTGREDGSTLSRDLTGDAKAVDFNRLPTGHCVLWRKHRDLIGVEVNAPLLSSPGELSARGRRYVQAIYDFSSPLRPETEPAKKQFIDAEVVETEVRKDAKRADSEPRQSGGLGEWL